ncbi:uncharacterized protein LOC110697398 [Chenopodium quinoa]|uniref:uncharacterized protein LOC110697398 n=1 Tax=Chenopodium quinoa TaxID=63459 RepID=UPI000B78BCC5|nr:uncharacterized protein LOC110697398 [Chenopodium quinoa]
MAVTIHENPPPSHKVRHYTITISSAHTISTTVTSHPGAARDWIHRTLYHHRRNRHRLIIGLGVQWTPNTISLINSPASTIQLCIGSRCLIFQLHHSLSSPRILRRILFDPRNTFVGLWSHSDAAKLLECDHKLEMMKGMPIDLRNHVFDQHGRSLQGGSIVEIAAQVLKVEIEWDRETSMSDWEVHQLSRCQVRQATVDAFVAFAIGMDVQAWKLNDYI